MATALIITGLVIGVAAGVSQVEAQRSASRARSRQKKNQALEVLGFAEEEVVLEEQRTERIAGSARALLASRGLKLTGSPFLFVSQIEKEGEEAVALLRARAQRGAQTLSRAARDIEKAGEKQQTAGIISLTASTVTGVGTILGQRAETA